MPKIINAYTSPDDSLGSSLSGLAANIFGQNVPQRELLRQKAFGAMRENENRPLAADALAAGDIANAIRYGVLADMRGADAAAYNLLGASGRAGDITDPALSKAFVGAGHSASGSPWGVVQTNNRQAQTQIAVADRMASQQQRQFDATFENLQRPDGVVVPVPRSQIAQRVAEGWIAPDTLDRTKIAAFRGTAPTAAPAAPTAVPFVDGGAPSPEGTIAPPPAPAGGSSLNSTQRSILGMPTQPRNYVVNGQNYITYDGVNDANGRPLPPGGHIANAQGSANDVGIRPNVQGALQGQIVNLQQAENFAGQILDLVNKDPSIVGPVGNVRRLGQNVVDVASSVSGAFGGTQGLTAQINSARQDLVQKYGAGAAQLLPELFNPDLNAVETLNGFLVYKTAEAMGQSGRGASDRDIKNVVQMTGSPASWLVGPTEYKNKVATIQSLLRWTRENHQRTLQNGIGSAPAGAPAAPNAAPLQNLKDKYGLQ